VACVVLDDNTALIISRPIVLNDRAEAIGHNTAGIVGARWRGIVAVHSVASEELKANRFVDHDPKTDSACLMVARFQRAAQESHADEGKYVQLCKDFARASELIAEHNKKLGVKND
jgi:hypothetical protein